MTTRIHYRVTPNPAAHLFEVTLRYRPKPGESQMTLSLPAWIPGSYMIREFSKNIVRIQATQGEHALPLIKIDKHTWQTAIADSADIEVRYAVYAWDLSVRTCYLDRQRGFFNGTSVCLRVHGRESDIAELDIDPPEGLWETWAVASGLTPARVQDETGLFAGAEQPLRWLAQNYDELIDCPVEMGRMVTAQFVACGVKHQVALTGAYDDVDLDRLCKDLTLICEWHIRLFDPRGEAPFSRYVFQIHATDNGYGGLEHRNSTALLCSRKDLPYKGMQEGSSDYRTFLGLCSHEYFHAWNVKRIKPRVLMDPQLGCENYTRLLWLFEGFTSYYDDLALLRTGLMSPQQYGEALGKTYSQVMKNLGHTVQTVSESSFDAWVKYYRQDENSPNVIVSYYTKGALIALCLDALIRQRTDHVQTLDDVMRWLWLNYGKAHRGVDEDEVPAIVLAATGVDVSDFLQSAVDSTDALPVPKALEMMGYALKEKAPEHPVDWGVSTAGSGEFLLVRQVRNGSAGETAGLASGDLIVAIDGYRATPDYLKQLLTRKHPGQASRIVALRRERLYEVELIWQARGVSEWLVEPVAAPAS